MILNIGLQPQLRPQHQGISTHRNNICGHIFPQCKGFLTHCIHNCNRNLKPLVLWIENLSKEVCNFPSIHSQILAANEHCRNKWSADSEALWHSSHLERLQQPLLARLFKIARHRTRFCRGIAGLPYHFRPRQAAVDYEGEGFFKAGRSRSRAMPN